MRKIILSGLLLVLSSGISIAAIESSVVVLSKSDIEKLTDDKIVDLYADTLVEIEAIKTFHTTSGFSTKQYDEYRGLLKFRLQLLMAIHSRNVEIPQQMER